MESLNELFYDIAKLGIFVLIVWMMIGESEQRTKKEIESIVEKAERNMKTAFKSILERELEKAITDLPYRTKEQFVSSGKEDSLILHHAIRDSFGREPASDDTDQEVRSVIVPEVEVTSLPQVKSASKIIGSDGVSGENKKSL